MRRILLFTITAILFFLIGVITSLGAGVHFSDNGCLINNIKNKRNDDCSKVICLVWEHGDKRQAEEHQILCLPDSYEHPNPLVPWYIRGI